MDSLVVAPLTPSQPVVPLSLGRLVHFILPEGPHQGHPRVAIVTGCHGAFANLTVFLDQPDDIPGRVDYVPMARAWSAPFSAAGEPGTWRYPVHL